MVVGADRGQAPSGACRMGAFIATSVPSLCSHRVPPPPPGPFSINDVSRSLTLFLTISLKDDQSKLSTFVPPTTIASSYNFLAHTRNSLRCPKSLGSSSDGSADSPSINPQL